MADSIQVNRSIELFGRDKERAEQIFLSYVRKCAERKEAKGQAGK